MARRTKRPPITRRVELVPQRRECLGCGRGCVRIETTNVTMGVRFCLAPHPAYYYAAITSPIKA